MSPSVPGTVPAGRSVTTTRRLTMGDVDAVQVYAPNYFRWMDESNHELFVSLGHPLGEVLQDGFGMPAVNASCEYLSPVVLDDLLECTTYVSRVGTASFDVSHEFRCDGRDIARGLMTHVWITIGDGQHAAPVPDWLRAGVEPRVAQRSVEPAGPRPGLAISRCPRCLRVGFPVEPYCVACGTETTESRSAAAGVLTTWTTVRQAPQGFEAPYVLGWVDLDDPVIPVMGIIEGGNGARLDDLRSGLAVRVSAIDGPTYAAGPTVFLEVAP